MADKTKTTFASSPLDVLANGLEVDEGGPYGGKTRVLFNYPDANHHGYDENTGEVCTIDTCSDGAPHFLGSYPQAEGIAQLFAAVPAMYRALRLAALITRDANGFVSLDPKALEQIEAALALAGPAHEPADPDAQRAREMRDPVLARARGTWFVAFDNDDRDPNAVFAEAWPMALNNIDDIKGHSVETLADEVESVVSEYFGT